MSPSSTIGDLSSAELELRSCIFGVKEDQNFPMDSKTFDDGGVEIGGIVSFVVSEGITEFTNAFKDFQRVVDVGFELGGMFSFVDLGGKYSCGMTEDSSSSELGEVS
ncbi:hypothetical protein L3Y34_013490 [Caenorhabditis briggsae]|uniref:Uncharacterized protein n=1 Tax=Caenorhabditis briggsae TaxID=6238 RepID=A0AAE8ZX30_CAEBR|nr:hypothetical protein L3Y34_013490 [Caenorhabditis briggsae]